MPESNFAALSDLSRLNWRGWLLLLLTAVGVIGTVVLMAMNGGHEGYRSARKAIGLVVALAFFGGFVAVAVILEKFGLSIYRQGMNPLDNIDISIIGKAPEPIAKMPPSQEDDATDAPAANDSHE